MLNAQQVNLNDKVEPVEFKFDICKTGTICDGLMHQKSF